MIIFIFERERAHLIPIENYKHISSNMLYCILVISVLSVLPHMLGRLHLDSKALALVYFKLTWGIGEFYTNFFLMLKVTQIVESRCRKKLKTTNKRTSLENVQRRFIPCECHAARFLISWALHALKKYIIFSFRSIARTKMCHIFTEYAYIFFFLSYNSVVSFYSIEWNLYYIVFVIFP